MASGKWTMAWLALALALVLALALAFGLALQVRLFRPDAAGWMVGVCLQGVQVGRVGLRDFRIAASIALMFFSVFSIDGASPKIARLVANSANDTDDMRQHGTKQYRRSLETGGEELSKLKPKLILTKNKISAHIDEFSKKCNLELWEQKRIGGELQVSKTGKKN